jgi:hypothetical protein
MTVHCYGSPESLEVACAPDSPEILSVYIYRGLDPALSDNDQASNAIYSAGQFTFSSISSCVIRPEQRSEQRAQRVGLPWTAMEEDSTSFGL